MFLVSEYTNAHTHRKFFLSKEGKFTSTSEDSAALDYIDVSLDRLSRVKYPEIFAETVANLLSMFSFDPSNVLPSAAWDGLWYRRHGLLVRSFCARGGLVDALYMVKVDTQETAIHIKQGKAPSALTSKSPVKELKLQLAGGFEIDQSV